jgi:hypothetical protein
VERPVVVSQLGLFDAPGGARRSDPDTSVAAARAHPTLRNSQRLALLRAFALVGRGLTDEEAGEIAGIRRVADTRRCSELRGAGLIADTGERRPTSTGSMAMVCRITGPGAAALKGER